VLLLLLPRTEAQNWVYQGLFRPARRCFVKWSYRCQFRAPRGGYVKWSCRCQFRAPSCGYVKWSWVLLSPVTGSTPFLQVVVGSLLPPPPTPRWPYWLARRRMNSETLGGLSK
jgi:hypothetical protein